MGKAARNRQQRRQQQHRQQLPHRSVSAPPWMEPPPDAVRGGSAAALDLVAKAMDDVEMPCRVTYSNDPLLGGPHAAVTDLRPDGTVITDPTELRPVPIVFFEPVQILAVKDTRTGDVHEARLETIVAGGFHRIPRGIMVNFPADGWGLHRTATGLLLRDRFGGVWAQSTVDLDPEWISEATSQGWVTVFYGPKLGIRTPPGKTEATYTLQHRITEFRQGRAEGLCAAANVRWHPVPTGETLTWVMLPAGALGQPLPVAYVPQFNFAPHGGPETLGFIPTPGSYAAIPTTPLLVGTATATDFDLLHPHLDDQLNFVAGYRTSAEYADGFTAWQQAAHAHGRVLVITGHRDLPAGPEIADRDPHTLAEQIQQALRDSYAAIVPLSPTPRRRHLPAWEDR